MIIYPEEMKQIVSNMTLYKEEIYKALMHIEENFEELSKYYISSNNSRSLSNKKELLMNKMKQMSNNIKTYVDMLDYIINTYVEKDKEIAQIYKSKSNDIN